jgi:hypothetical protein
MTNPINKLQTIPSGRCIREVLPHRQADVDGLDWQFGGDATKLMVAKINETIDAVRELQQALDEMGGATIGGRGGEG